MRAITRIFVGVMLLAFVLFVFVSTQSARGPIHHISQQEANARCPSGIAYPEQVRTEGTTDGHPDDHSFYPCSDGSSVASYQS